jgi:S1-C subfamily serine protease
MRAAATAFFIGLVGLVPNTSFLLAAGIFSGSGVVIGTYGEILTNSHVVEDCKTIRVQFSSTNSGTAVLVAQDKRNDLAVIKTETAHGSVAEFRDGPAVRAGDTVVAMGYPRSGT